MCAEYKDEEKIFYTAIELKSPAQRQAYLKQVCRDDANLLARIQALLAVHDSKESVLEVTAASLNLSINEEHLSEGPGSTIGRYKLLEKIGEGGMAVVYMAEQTEPIRRKVALKIIKLGMDTKQVIARFEAERQALAILDHPNIAKVLDAGATETGRPYFVMDLVKGISITEYCDQNNLSTKERLELFIQVCNAIQHAHQKGIIHRDIKPSNIMVTMHDGKAAIKVIDFGIAKAINQRLTEKTLFTRYAHIIGTPAYMSPEQAQMSDMDIDIRTDIYSLGVLLYELLTGTTPFSEEELRKAGYLEMQRVIIEQEPAKPSTKLISLCGTLTDIAKHRSSTPNLLTKAVRGDLDWIVMKALEKDRSRRYEQAEGLALDIQRHFEHRPIFAHAPSTCYRLHKFYRRYRTQTIAVLTIIILVLTIISILLFLSYKQYHLEKEDSFIDRLALSKAESFLKLGDLSPAFAEANQLLDSKYVKHEAQLIIDRIAVKALDKLNKHTDKIQADPEDANNYFRRALQYYNLYEEKNVRADMDRYRAILNPPQGTEAYDNWLNTLVRKKASYGLLFGREMNLGPTVNSVWQDSGPDISYDGLKIYFASTRPGGHGQGDIFVTSRPNRDAPWGRSVNLGPPVNTSYTEAGPCISADELSLYFFSNRPSGYGKVDIWIAKRATPNDPWQEPINLSINSLHNENHPSITKDGLELYFFSDRPGGYGDFDIWMTKRTTINDPWQVPTNLGKTINSPRQEVYGGISPDGLALFFDSDRNGGVSTEHLWIATRTNRSSDWSEPMHLLSGSGPAISGDGRIFVFTSGPRNDIGVGAVYHWQGEQDVWEVPIIPNLDFNGDGNIDANDLQILNDNQGTIGSPGKSICDIGPMPWGDGVIDENDLEVFMRNWK
jgi:serine/threonine protein kinase